MKEIPLHTKITELCKEEAINFTNWILSNGWNSYGNVNNRFWKSGIEAKTTEELYDLFTNES